MTDGPTYGFDTLQIHAGARPDPATGARQTPIYQSTAYVFRDAEHAAALFNLQEVGFIYSRLTNPTVAVLQERIATLEGGVGAVCCSSGHAAQIMALFPLMGPGKNIVASTRLYGGTVTQFSQTIKRFGWSAKFVDFDDLDAVKAAIDDDTRAVFGESIANPGGYITDIRAIADVADAAGVPLIIDNTSATPYLCRPIEHGATLVTRDALSSQSDFITLHTPLNDATRGIISKDALAKMKKGVRIVNCARGGLIDESALKDAISYVAVDGAIPKLNTPATPERILMAIQEVTETAPTSVDAQSETA